MFDSIKLDFPTTYNNQNYVVKIWNGREWEEVYRSGDKIEAITKLLERIIRNGNRSNPAR